jgi:NACalpha-BTF3-like transcription factor
MIEAKAQAAQLDSVTDVVQEQEVDATRAQQAMNAFLSDGNEAVAATATPTLHADFQDKLNVSSPNSSSGNNAASSASALIRAEDIQLLCNEFDVTEDIAIKALRDAANEIDKTTTNNNSNHEKDALVILALQKLIVS